VQKNNGSGATDNVTFQFDYINPYTDSNKIEFGVRSNYRYNTSKLDVTLNDTNGNFVFNPYLSNNYRIDDIVNAIYINYASYWYAGITYQLGVRFEQTDFVARLPDKSLQFEYTYPKGSNNLVKAFFPSLYLSRRIGSSHEFQLNFSRKINRPNFMQVMPFIMFSDRQSYRIGNPALSPEFINTAEANYNFIFGKGNVLTSAFYKLQQSPITTYVYTLPSDSSVLVSTFVNGNNGYNYGLENTFKYLFFKKKLEMTINTNITYAIINATLGSTGGNTTLQNSGSFWSTKMILQYKLPAQFSIQANGSYESPKIIPQGKTVEVYSIDLSLSKDIGKSLSFSLTVNDIFNTKRWGAIYTTDLFYQDFSRRWETRFVRVNFTWRFGEMDVSLFRRKNRNRGEGGSMDMEY
jgi:hypothetical protein